MQHVEQSMLVVLGSVEDESRPRVGCPWEGFCVPRCRTPYALARVGAVDEVCHFFRELEVGSPWPCGLT